MVPKQTIGCFLESIGCFGFDSKLTIKTVFNLFLKTLKYKTVGCFEKTTGCFSLSLKNTFLLKRLIMSMLWIQSRVDYINNLPQILSKIAQQQQAQSSLQHPSNGFGFFKA